MQLSRTVLVRRLRPAIFPIALAAAALAGLAFPALVPAQEPNQEEPGQDSCVTESGPLKVTSVLARPPGGEFENALDKLCGPLIEYREDPDGAGGTYRTAYVILQLKSGDQDLSAVYPQGTLFSVTVESSGPEPLFLLGVMDNPVAQFEGQKVTFQGESTTVNFPANGWTADGSPDCSGGTLDYRSWLRAIVALEPIPEDPALTEYLYRGTYVGTNSPVPELPVVSEDGDTVEVGVQGCGDGDPSTEEGFFKGFVPANGVAEMGIDQSLLESLSDELVDQLMQLLDNGVLTPDALFELASQQEVALTPPAVGARTQASEPAGITIDYRFSYSVHRLATTSNRKNVRRAKTCRRQKGKLKVRGGKLTCKKKKKPGRG